MVGAEVLSKPFQSSPNDLELGVSRYHLPQEDEIPEGLRAIVASLGYLSQPS